VSAASVTARSRDLPSDPTLPVPTARGLAFVALATFGVLHWMVLLEPAEPNRALYALGCGLLAMFGMLGAARLQPRAAQAAAVGVLVVTLALAILGGGVADELLRPDRWGELSSGISRGIEALPGIRVPYRGVDVWTRTVIPLGGTVLVTLAAALAFWPRRNGRTGFPGIALFLLVALYAIPAVALDFENEFLRGAALALLVLAFLRLEKLRVGDASNAGLVAAGVAVLALMLAPALDGDEPWWDYESWALNAASARSTSFSWNHDYGPLDWPRDGRELLRVRAQRRAAYWKAENLDTFDGVRWIQTRSDFEDPSTPNDAETIALGTQRIRVTIRNLSTDDFVTAGWADEVDSPTLRETPRGDGTWSASRTLRRGDAYEATVYTPQTTEEQRQAAGPETDRADVAAFRRVLLSGTGTRIGQTGAPLIEFQFPQFGDTTEQIQARTEGNPQAIPGRFAVRALRNGPYARTYELAQELADESDTQEDYVQAVLRYLRSGFVYSETPPRSASNLDGFLFDAKAGYCQQFSGAMALLLRMGGVPARVSTGFTSGSLDAKTREFVVRDLDAHSWVEVWYHDIGWVTFDPTPADAPPRAQPNEGGDDGPTSALAGPPSLGGGDRPADPGRRGAAVEETTWWGWYVIAGVGAVLVLVIAVLLWRARRRRRGTPPAAVMLDELERALYRTRRHPGAGTTLSGLEQHFARSPAAAGYVRAVRELRYGGRPVTPTSAQRRGLRGELARGGGVLGRLRAWWALPPHP
jgi:transglutaminase-like putative cysteine protease